MKNPDHLPQDFNPERATQPRSPEVVEPEPSPAEQARVFQGVIGIVGKSGVFVELTAVEVGENANDLNTLKVAKLLTQFPPESHIVYENVGGKWIDSGSRVQLVVPYARVVSGKDSNSPQYRRADFTVEQAEVVANKINQRLGDLKKDRELISDMALSTFTNYKSE